MISHILITLLLSICVESENSRKLLFSFPSSFNSWIAPTSPLITGYQYFPGIYSCAVGYYNNTIYLLGGFQDKKQLISYDMLLNEFTYIGQDILPSEAYGNAQFYTQNGDIIYMIDSSPFPDGDGNKFSTFNVETREFISNWNNISFPVGVRSGGCLSYFNHYLFVVGGAEAGTTNVLRLLQIFNMSSGEWLSSIPQMVYARHGGSCIVHPATQQLYAIGGYGWNHTIEKIFVGNNLTDISNRNWQIIGNILSVPVTNWYFYGSRAIVVGNDVVIIGGNHHVNGNEERVKEITVIDSTTNTLRSGGFLNYGIYATSVININNEIVYLFGGYGQFGEENRRDQWQYKHLTPTNDPTISPTSVPSSSPTTSDPTMSPSKTPTNNPTLNPTAGPSKQPTAVPTLNPTTSDPTMYPSKTPTDNPTLTKNPTVSPTSNPTDIPSVSPITSAPTIYPSGIPTVAPSNYPSVIPTAGPSKQPTAVPTENPTRSPTIDCDTKVCCNGEAMTKCKAINECSDAWTDLPDACTDDVYVCPDKVTYISRNECCQFDKDECEVDDPSYCTLGMVENDKTSFVNDDATTIAKIRANCQFCLCLIEGQRQCFDDITNINNWNGNQYTHSKQMFTKICLVNIDTYPALAADVDGTQCEWNNIRVKDVGDITGCDCSAFYCDGTPNYIPTANSNGVKQYGVLVEIVSIISILALLYIN